MYNLHTVCKSAHVNGALFNLHAKVSSKLGIFCHFFGKIRFYLALGLGPHDRPKLTGKKSANESGNTSTVVRLCLFVSTGKVHTSINL